MASPPAWGGWLEEYGGFALVVGFAALLVRRGVLLSRENQRLNLHLQEEVERKTKGMNTLLVERRELLANLLHDLKNPLAALRGYVELVRSGDVAMDQETAGYLNALTERVDALGERFTLLQDFSRGERGMFPQGELCLNEFLRQFYHSNLPDMELNGIHFQLELWKEPLLVRGNQERLQAALENLCYNALSFTPEEGTIALGLRREEDWALIVVRDTGAGIAPEQLPHIFQRGYSCRADNSGEGLGLYIVRAIILEHGGTVQVDSQVGKGSAFTIRLPLVNPTPAPDEQD